MQNKSETQEGGYMEEELNGLPDSFWLYRATECLFSIGLIPPSEFQVHIVAGYLRASADEIIMNLPLIKKRYQ